MKNDFSTFVNNLPKELADIALQNWDPMGHSTKENPQAEAIIALLKKNGGASEQKFIEDMKTLFPYIGSREVKNYYSIFISCSKFVTQEISCR